MDWQALWDWLSNPTNQQSLAWLGGVAAVAAGIWALSKFLLRREDRRLEQRRQGLRREDRRLEQRHPGGEGLEVADIFLSYTREDAPIAQRLARALEDEGWSVSLDRHIPPGRTFDEVIQEKMAAARCVVVLWSKTSVESKWVKIEANAGSNRGILIPVALITIEMLPLAFRFEQTVSLVGWTGEKSHRGYQSLVDAISPLAGQPRTKARRESKPQPQARRESKPQPQARSQRDPPRRRSWWRELRKGTEEEIIKAEPSMSAPLNSVPKPPRIARFTVYHPKEITSERWDTILVYAHTPDKQEWVYADAQARLDQSGSYGQRGDRAKRDIAEGAEVIVVPELPGCEFNPPIDRFRWLEGVHRREFRLRPTPAVPGFAPGTAVNGRVALYVASILIAEVGIWAFISDQQPAATSMIMPFPATASAPTGIQQHIRGTADPYSAIFVSYAHEDGTIVNRLGAAYKALGMNFLRDQEVLRSGERWNPTLLALIEQADIFQLFWSNAARRSRYVKQEWGHAIQQARDNFIRPVYWQQPLPKPPRALGHLHFAYLPFDAAA